MATGPGERVARRSAGRDPALRAGRGVQADQSRPMSDDEELACKDAFMTHERAAPTLRTRDGVVHDHAGRTDASYEARARDQRVKTPWLIDGPQDPSRAKCRDVEVVGAARTVGVLPRREPRQLAPDLGVVAR